MEIIKKAIEARTLSYSPYSEFSVGAALLCSDGSIYMGGNIENASYGASICAERSAFIRALLDGKRDFTAIAVSGGKHSDTVPTDYAYPCGICRQFMSEFCAKNFKIYVVKTTEDYKEFTMEELLPASFEL